MQYAIEYINRLTEDEVPLVIKAWDPDQPIQEWLDAEIDGVDGIDGLQVTEMQYHEGTMNSYTLYRHEGEWKLVQVLEAKEDAS